MDICIFDDEVIFQNSLNNIIEDIFDVDFPGFEYTVNCFSETPALFDYILKNNTDVVFLDIATPDNDDAGLLTARQIRATNEDMHIVFVTSHKDKINRSFDGMVRPTGFLIKPIDKGYIRELLRNIIRQRIRSNDYISLKFGRIEYLIRIDEIYSLQKFAHKMVVLTANRSLEVINTISSIEDVLPENFVKIDQGIIVNFNFVDRVDYAERSVILKNGDRYTVSRNSKGAVKEAIGNIVAKIS